MLIFHSYVSLPKATHPEAVDLGHHFSVEEGHLCSLARDATWEILGIAPGCERSWDTWDTWDTGKIPSGNLLHSY